MKNNTIVSLADSNYYELLNELIDSIKSFKESSNVAICILDAGLSEDQKNLLSKKLMLLKRKKVFLYLKKKNYTVHTQD